MNKKFIYLELINEINEKYNDGDKFLSERQIASMYDVSKTKAREALKRLEFMGFLIAKLKSGYIVQKPMYKNISNALSSYDNILDIRVNRIILEEGAIKLIFQRDIEQSFIDDITEINEIIGQNINDPIKSTEADYLFHLRIIQEAKSKLLESIFEGFYNEIIKMAIVGKNEEEGVIGTFEDHKKIIEAFSMGYEQTLKSLENHFYSFKKFLNL